MQEGLTAAQITDLEHYASSAQFSAREKLALTYAERITRSDQDVDEALFARVQQEFPTPRRLSNSPPRWPLKISAVSSTMPYSLSRTAYASSSNPPGNGPGGGREEEPCRSNP